MKDTFNILLFRTSITLHDRLDIVVRRFDSSFFIIPRNKAKVKNYTSEHLFYEQRNDRNRKRS